MIAEKARVDHVTVGAVRKAVEATGEIHQSDTRVGKNGVEKPATTATPACQNRAGAFLHPPDRSELPGGQAEAPQGDLRDLRPLFA